MNQKQVSKITFGLLFVLARLIFFLSVPYQAIPGYGDYWNFYGQAQLGWPFLDYWTEFPPVFPFIARVIYLLAGGSEQAFGYLLALLMSLFQAGSIVLVLELADRFFPQEKNSYRALAYLAISFGLFYTWSYFDPLAVFFMLLGIYWLDQKRDAGAAIALALGALTKWFPVLVLPAVWKARKGKTAARITLMVIGLVALVWGALFLASPDLTRASFTSQATKGSWETVWALIDGNLGTGNFSPEIDHLKPETSSIAAGQSAVIPPWASLLVLGGVGLYLWWRSEPSGPGWIAAFSGLTLAIFLLWSPGYSPQWVLYLLPLILLSLPLRESLLLAAIMVLVNLLEWPLLLSRGNFEALYYLIPVRTGLLILLALRLFQTANVNLKGSKNA